MTRAPVLAVDDLHVEIPTARGLVRAVRGVSFEIHPGETFALVGESGAGKSMTCRAIMGLLHEPARLTRGAVRLRGEDLRGLSEAQMQRVRGGGVGMIFQDAMNALHPLLTIERQIVETFAPALGRAEARARAIALLQRVGIPDPAHKLEQYPHELSAGQRQRVMIAIALARSPAVLLADEPTSALDVTIQAQIVRLLSDLKAQNGMALLLVTHDLGVVSEAADRVGVMYAGEIVETANTKDLLKRPAHPYTLGLLRSMPGLEEEQRPLLPILGSPPDLGDLPAGCAFAERCSFAVGACREREPPVVLVEEGRFSRCHRALDVYGLAGGGGRD